jgi:uncharacterized protein YjbI with pentapeptide repeats
MGKVTQEELDQILADHALWLYDQRTGERAQLKYADLSNTKLIDANLTNANLYGADLINTNLSGANLTGAHLSGANLINANLSGANLTGVNLSYANLRGANLTDANLSDANLLDANLTDANLLGAKFGLNIIDATSIYYATFSKDALKWLILRDDWADERAVDLVDRLYLERWF